MQEFETKNKNADFEEWLNGSGCGYQECCGKSAREKLQIAFEAGQNSAHYQSVKDALPPSDGIFYDVMVILYNDNISGGFNYYRGQYQDGFFFADGNMFRLEEDFRCSWSQQKVIAWKYLEKCTNAQIDKFREKAGCL